MKGGKRSRRACFSTHLPRGVPVCGEAAEARVTRPLRLTSTATVTVVLPPACLAQRRTRGTDFCTTRRTSVTANARGSFLGLVLDGFLSAEETFASDTGAELATDLGAAGSGAVDLGAAALATDLGATDSGAALATESGAVDAGAALATESGAVDSGAVLAMESGAADAGTALATESGAVDSGAALAMESGAADAGAALATESGAVDAAAVLAMESGAAVGGAEAAAALATVSGAADVGAALATESGATEAGADAAAALMADAGALDRGTAELATVAGAETGAFMTRRGWVGSGSLSTHHVSVMAAASSRKPPPATARIKPRRSLRWGSGTLTADAASKPGSMTNSACSPLTRPAFSTAARSISPESSLRMTATDSSVRSIAGS